MHGREQVYFPINANFSRLSGTIETDPPSSAHAIVPRTGLQASSFTPAQIGQHPPNFCGPSCKIPRMKRAQTTPQHLQGFDPSDSRSFLQKGIYPMTRYVPSPIRVGVGVQYSDIRRGGRVELLAFTGPSSDYGCICCHLYVGWSCESVVQPPDGVGI